MRQYNPTLRLGVRVIYPSLYTKTAYPKVSIETVGCVHTNFYIARTLDLSASRTTKGAWSARTITAIRDPKKGNRPISDNRWFSPRNFSSFYLKGDLGSIVKALNFGKTLTNRFSRAFHGLRIYLCSDWSFSYNLASTVRWPCCFLLPCYVKKNIAVEMTSSSCHKSFVSFFIH